MRKITLIRGARQLLTLRGPDGPRRGAELGNLGLIQDGAVLVADGLVLEVGSSRRIENLALARQAEEIDASGCVVMPGFVDPNVQIAGGAHRTFDDGQNRRALAGDPYALANTKSLHALSLRVLESMALRRVEQAIRHGTTALEAKSGISLTDAGEMKTLRAPAALRSRLPLVSTLFGARPAAHDCGKRLEDVAGRLLPAVRHRKLADFVELLPTPDISREQARRFLERARSLGFALKVCAGPESREAVSLVLETGVAVIDHVTSVSNSEAAHLASSDVVATVSPALDASSGSHGASAARKLVDSGAAVALATNYSPTGNPALNMQTSIALACRDLGLTTAEAISCATINAAHALRRASRIGSLEAGKDADLLVLGIPDYRELPYHFGVNVVDTVTLRGAVVARRTEVVWPAP